MPKIEMHHQTVLVDPSLLIAHEKNAAIHSSEQVINLARSFEKFGFIGSVQVGSYNKILAGHGRVEAALLAGMSEIPVVDLSHLSEEEQRAFMIADNKLSEQKGWDHEIFEAEFKDLLSFNLDLSELGIGLDDIVFHGLEEPEHGEKKGKIPEKKQFDTDDDEDGESREERYQAEDGDGETEGEREADDEIGEKTEHSFPTAVEARAKLGDVWSIGKHKIICGDSSNAQLVHSLIPEESAHSIVTDPPYGISFMGKEWDHGVPSAELWKVWISRVTPGAHILSFCATRMYHHMALNIERAGFEARDMIAWMYGSGFPKSANISKQIDKAAGAERDLIGPRTRIDGKKPGHSGIGANGIYGKSADLGTLVETAPSTHAAKQWNGWGSAIKPSHEPIMLARKPCLEKTLAKNVVKYGTGALNIDASRIGYAPTETDSRVGTDSIAKGARGNPFADKTKHQQIAMYKASGRWPANTILSHADGCVEVGVKKIASNARDSKGSKEGGIFGGANCATNPPSNADGTETVEAWECAGGCPVAELDRQSLSGGMHSAGKARDKKENFDREKSMFGIGHEAGSSPRLGDSGGASRFFMVIKKSISDERASECGLEKIEGDDTSVGKKKGNRKDNSSIDTSGRKQTVQFLMGTISITETETHSITTFQILNASTAMSIGLCTVVSEKITSLLTVSTIESVSLVSNTEALIYFTDESLEPIKGIASIVIEQDSQNGVQKTENTITPTIESIAGSRFYYIPKPSRSDKSEGNDHATVKPVRLMEYLIRMITPKGGTVLEPFAGSGTTVLACEKLHMKCIAFELDPHHVDIILTRMESLTGLKAEKK